MRLTGLIVPILLVLPAVAADKQEEKLIERLLKSQLAVEHANEKSERDGALAEAHCKHRGQVLRIKPNGRLGCVTEPAKAADPTKELEKPKAEPAKPETAKPEPPKEK